MTAAPPPPPRDRAGLEQREIDFFASYYGDQTYNATGWRLRMQRELRALLRAAGSTGLGRVLSIGCGDGRFEQLVAQHAEHVTAIDISPEAIELTTWKNALTAYAQTGQIDVEALLRPAVIDQRELYNDNSVLRGQSPRVDDPVPN